MCSDRTKQICLWMTIYMLDINDNFIILIF